MSDNQKHRMDQNRSDEFEIAAPFKIAIQGPR